MVQPIIYNRYLCEIFISTWGIYFIIVDIYSIFIYKYFHANQSFVRGYKTRFSFVVVVKKLSFPFS